MPFDFQKQFECYSNIELLKITQSPENYQSAAVDAATTLLKNRTITEDELAAVHVYYIQLEQHRNNKSFANDHMKRMAISFLEPLLHFKSHRKAGDWLNIFAAILILMYFNRLVSNLGSFFTALGYHMPLFSAYLFSLVDLVYYPVFLLWFVKRKPIGWIFLTVIQVYGTVTGVLLMLFYVDGNIGSAADIRWHFFLKVAAHGAVVLFLWQRSVIEKFRINVIQKRTIVFASAGATILIQILLSTISLYVPAISEQVSELIKMLMTIG